MKKFSILILAVAMIFSFASCDNNSIEYADSQAAADLVNAIAKDAVAQDLIKAASGTPVNGLKITYDFPDGFPTSGSATTIKVTGTFSDANGGYTSGFHTNQGATWAITSGSGTVYVKGTYTNEGGTQKFVLDSYSATTTPIVVTKTVGEDETKYTFELKKLEGKAEGTITRSSGAFSVDTISLTVPTADKVEAYLDEKPVDYNKLCSETGFTPGESKVTYTPVTE